MPIGLEEYLHARGFHGDPFAKGNAGQEEFELPSFFVHIVQFDRLADNQSLILFAPPGHGKTSYRMEIARYIKARRMPPLVITFTEFDLLLRLDHLTTDTYLEVLRRMIVAELDKQIQPHSDRERLFQRNEAAYTQFCMLLLHYIPQRAQVRWLPPHTRSIAPDLAGGQISRKQALTELTDLVRQADFAEIYILLDGLDEWPETRNNHATMLRLLQPLLDAPGLLQDCGVAFKFFLPEVLRSAVLEQFRCDRIREYSLVWDDRKLLDMLERRLAYYSRLSETSDRGRVEHFQDLCDAGFDVDVRLVQLAKQSPRLLIQLIARIIDKHCQVACDLTEKIDAATIESVLGATSDQPSVPVVLQIDSINPLVTPDASIKSALRAGVDQQSELIGPPIDSATTPGTTMALFIDQRHDIYLGDQPLGSPLPKYLYRCIICLWQNRNRQVSTEELIDAVYQDDAGDLRREDPKDSLVRIISRLRKALEPHSAPASKYSTSRTYVDGRSSIGYRLRNFREEQRER